MPHSSHDYIIDVGPRITHSLRAWWRENTHARLEEEVREAEEERPSQKVLDASVNET